MSQRLSDCIATINSWRRYKSDCVRLKSSFASECYQPIIQCCDLSREWEPDGAMNWALREKVPHDKFVKRRNKPTVTLEKMPSVCKRSCGESPFHTQKISCQESVRLRVHRQWLAPSGLYQLLLILLTIGAEPKFKQRPETARNWAESATRLPYSKKDHD